MLVRAQPLLALVGLVGTALGLPTEAARAINVHDLLMRVGDDPSWSSPTLNDDDWEIVDLHDIPHTDSIVWLRAQIELRPEHLEPYQPLGIYFAALASHEIWWDGERIGRGGVVGSSAESEQPGPIQAHYVIPERLAAPGSHQLAIRTSAFHRHFVPRSGYWMVLVAGYDNIVDGETAYGRIALISLSGIVMVALFALMMFIQDSRDRSFLFLGLLCCTAAVLLIAESWRFLFGYTYNWHLLRLSIVTGLSWLLDVFLLVFLARRFPMSHARWFMGCGIVAATLPILLIHAWDPKAYVGFYGVFFLATAWCLRASWRKLPGSVFAFVGVACCLVVLSVQPFRFVDRNLYLSLNFLLICLLASHVLQVRQSRRERDEAMLKSARLEIELLKRHIQPHFLMNTLTALSEWIEKQPQLASRMIQALSEEFRVLSDISHQRLIQMKDEIRLCRSHLEIMSHRKQRSYRMTTDGVDLEALIPPAVIHTLVENAITHNPSHKPDVEFRLSEDRQNGYRRYVFSSPLMPNSTEDVPSGEGTGLRYIRARMQESYGEDFKLRSHAQDQQWRTEIWLPRSQP